jgi:hypothetical protein
MLKRRHLKESERTYAIASAYYDEYYDDYVESCGRKPSFSFKDIEYFTVNNRKDGLTEVVFYNKNNEFLFNDIY